MASALDNRLAARELRAISAHAITRTCAKGAAIVSEGDATNSLFVVMTGRVRVFLADSAGREIVLGEAGPGEYFGEMTLNGGPRTATVTALKETWAVGLLVDNLDRFSPACHARFSNAFLAIMAQRIAMLSGRLQHTLQSQKIGMV